MIELTFGESSGGALKVAKSMKQGDCVKMGVPGMFRGSRKERHEARKPYYWSGLTMEGSAGDVGVLMLVLDIGDISGMDIDMKRRKNELDMLYGDFQGVPDEMWNVYKHTLMRLDEAKATMEPVRIWVCDSSPAEMCGLYFFCDLMRTAKTPLSVVHVPERLERDNTISIYHSTGEIDPELLGSFTEYEEPISQLQRITYANIWRDLVNENAPLRTLINGNLMGVPEYFYDFALRANMPSGEFRVAQLIGKTLIQISGVSDRWLFLRIQAMLKSGELIMVSPATEDHPYSGVVKRSHETTV